MEPARTSRLDRETARWLVGPEGRAAIDRATRLLADGQESLEVGSGLRAGGIPPARAAAVMDAATARRRHPHLGEATILTGAGAEQTSHPAVSAWRAGRYEGIATVADLCAGLGGDAATLATGGRLVVAVEVDPATVVLLAHNLSLRAATAMAVRGDAGRPPVARDTAFFADPSRRSRGRRLRRLAETVPTVPTILEAMGGSGGCSGGVAVSPALPLDDPGLPLDAEVAFVAVEGRLVEATLWLGDLRRSRVDATAVTIHGDRVHEQHRTGPPAVLPVRPPEGILLEPSPAAVRARLHTDLGQPVGAWRVAERRALLCVGADPGPSPWWTRWLIEAVLPPRPRKVRAWLRTAEPLPLSISAHGLPGDVERWFAQLGSPPRGPQGRRLHLVRTDDGAVAIAARSAGTDRGREGSLGGGCDSGRVET